jgi:hypothetical protein
MSNKKQTKPYQKKLNEKNLFSDTICNFPLFYNTCR